MKAVLAFGMLLVLCSGCAPFNPQIGMTYSQFAHDSAGSLHGNPELVAAQEDAAVYNLPTSQDTRTLYVFRDALLEEVIQPDLDQVQAPETPAPVRSTCNPWLAAGAALEGGGGWNQGIANATLAATRCNALNRQ